MNQPNAYNPFPGEMVLEQRTSIMAIASLMCSLLCFLPGFSIIGVLLGVVAVMLIANSNGKLVGRGMAIAGIIIGLIVSAIWISIAVGAIRFAQATTSQFTKPVNTMMESIEKRDYATARTYLTTAASNRVTDADFDRFWNAYQAEVGAYKNGPMSFAEIISSYQQLGPQMKAMQNTQGIVPYPGHYEKGWILVMLQLDQKGGTTISGFDMPISNVLVVGPTGNRITLYEGTAPTSSGGTTTVLPGGIRIETNTGGPPASGPARAGVILSEGGKIVKIMEGAGGALMLEFEDGTRVGLPDEGASVEHGRIVIEHRGGEVTLKPKGN
jgi:hypothetical protein